MSQGPQHPFHNQSSQHDYSQPPFPSAPPVYANYHHLGAFPPQPHNPQGIASHASYNGVYNQPTAHDQFGSNQHAYPSASSAFTGNFATLAPELQNLPSFPSTQWNQQPYQSHSPPQPIPQHAYGNYTGLSHEHFQQQQQQQQQQQHSAQLHPAPQFPLKQEPADFDSISTPPLPPIDSATSSPQKPALRIKLKRTFKTQESSSGAQQAQAQLQIDPSAMPIGRPTRSAATAASANIHSSFSDAPTNRPLRTRQVKQQPGSEEEYEQVSPQRQQAPGDAGDYDDGEDDDDDDDEQQESGSESEPEPEPEQPDSISYQPAAKRGQALKITLTNKGKKLDKGKQKAPARSSSSNSSSRASSSASATRPPKSLPSRASARPESEPTRRSERLSRDSQPPSSRDPTLPPSPLLLLLPPPLPPQRKARSFEVMTELQRRQLDADEQDDDDADADEDADGEHDAPVKHEDAHDDEEPEPVLSTSRSGRIRRTKVLNMAESEASDVNDDDDDDEEAGPRRSSRRLKSNALEGFVASDNEEEEDDEGEYGAKRSTRSSGRLTRGSSSTRLAEMAAKKRAANNGRGRPPKRKPKDDEYELEGEETPEEEQISGAEDDPLDIHSDEPEGSQGKSYSLRQRKKVNYSLVPPPTSPPRDGFGRTIRNSRGRGGNGAYDLEPTGSGAAPGGAGGALPMPFPGRGKKGKEGWDALPSSMSGKDYARIFGDPIDSSDDELQNNALRKPGAPAPLGGGAAGGLLGAGGAAGAGGPPGGLTGSGGTDSFGRIKKSGDPLADVDPLGVDMNIDFDSVGGLDGHIQQLKEMVMLPLLYPEVFQRFKVTPPRGVLFHGPPGTGKTLVARALAASCSTEGQQVSFFMRKGADCLSKWVGEAERQLRLLFEEARNSQPSIIFFDEIDGLAPVRSSKQDQIHASIVSTMLALMDGMDGRGQVVVIGATNRPDSVDPALRRPGRFDREFYFPLPSLEARKSIINIHTRKWEPPLDDDFKARLAEVTKGYGGADLRALCTEAALNAIQRRYPQIYSTTDRLLLDPASIQVDAKDFMMSVNKIVPSSARASASAAAPLPERLAPLLGNVVEHAIGVLDKILPPVSKRNPLEEALWEDDAFAHTGLTSGLSAADKLGGDRGFGREMLLQSFEAQRVYRPRMLVHGDAGMGQGAVGAALLQHLEGYHVQSLDIGTLLGDSARTPEAAIIQLFVEAKRHKPSVLYIPGLVHWSHSVSESVKTTFKALLDGLTDADPVMLLGIAEAPLDELDDEVHSWFNFFDDEAVEIPRPKEESRREFFQEIFDHIIRPPTEFPDALPRRKRVLEELPKAPPRPPRKLTQAELQQQAENDAKLLEHLKYRLGPVLAELRKKFKKFTRDVWDEYNLRELTQRFDWKREKGKITIELVYYEPQHPVEAANDETEDVTAMLETEADIAAKRGITAAQFMGGPAATITEIETEQNGEGADAEVGAAAAQAGEDSDVSMTNGDAAIANGAVANGIPNGIDVAAGGESLGENAVPPASSQINGIAAGAGAGAADADASSAPALADTSIASAPGAANSHGNGIAANDPDYRRRTMPIFTTNLEKMQKRLYYNGYLSCSAFMEDIQKIVENAEEAAEVDQDRVFRAHQMRNLAIVLMDQYIDAGFREECDRMALRQMAREQEAKEATEKAKQSAEEAAAKKAEGAKGERASARIAGKEPELASGLESGDRLNNKRQRSVSAQVAPADPEAGTAAVEPMVEDAPAGEEEARKRARIDSPSHAEITETSIASAAPVVPTEAPAAQVEPAPEHPPLEYTKRSYEELKALIVASSSSYNIDQLSRLRAACFNAIWTHRSDWDRNELIGELIEIATRSQEAVRRELAKKTRGAIGL
ncbi:related to YTA7-26S proteasome subunit [Sporisorium reilianum f. sp. reilianum]|uniref:Related to YTA7-26S proteasome subunit n=1 Tax=Sporisorium reilianum f. sp. reilianum TaxID=72559 RepID=A0A2N8UIW9_9BASI|nr:related to YTA7-26S proteasome subunit [Sporisorium reilianum f. sp. reilianum]